MQAIYRQQPLDNEQVCVCATGNTSGLIGRLFMQLHAEQCLLARELCALVAVKIETKCLREKGKEREMLLLRSVN